MTANLNMPRSRKIIRNQDAMSEQLRKEVKAKGGVVLRPRTSKRDVLIEAAASGRPADIKQQAREALAQRRAAQVDAGVQRSLDMIAGRV